MNHIKTAFFLKMSFLFDYYKKKSITCCLGRKVSVDVESNRTIEVYDNLDRVFREAVEEATKHIIEDCIKRGLFTIK